MKLEMFKKLAVAISIPLILFGFTLATQQDSPHNILVECLFISFVVHWFFGLQSIFLCTEKFFDLTGSIAVLSMLYYALQHVLNLGNRAILLLAFCAIWTIRLGAFLFIRIMLHKVDRRFNDIKKSPLSFIITWHLSATWTFLTIVAALCAITSSQQQPLFIIDMIFILMWLLGFFCEFFADLQKFRFKKKKSDLPFINSGLWSYSRHPNYLGEIVMWFAIAGLALPNLYSWSLLSLISPFFVSILLIKISGINLLEENNDKKFGHLHAYKVYKETTPILFPLTRQKN